MSRAETTMTSDGSVASTVQPRRRTDATPLLGRARRIVDAWRPPLDRREFWAVQLLVLAIAGGHLLIEANEGEISGALVYIPASLFLVPVVYAALNFGVHGSVPTALWCAIVTAPNLLLFHHEADRLGEIWQLGVVLLVAWFVGHRVDSEKRARQQAEEREQARRLSEEKYRGVFDHVAEPILLLGPQHEIEDANEAAGRLFDLDRELLMGKPLQELIEIDATELSSPSTRPSPIRSLVVGEKSRWIQPILIPLAADQTMRTELMLRDLTAEYERQRELEAYAKRTTEAREEERGRIARSLHDGPVQSLVLIWRRLDDLGELDDPSLDAEIRAAQRAVRDAADELRRVSRDLRPSVLDDLGLASALRAEVASFSERSGVSARLISAGTERRLSLERDLALLRIAQEALRNIARHAHARRATIRLSYDAARVRLSISDDGDGIAERSTSDLVAAGKLGVIGMREQARLIGAEISIAPGARRGTVVSLTVPA